MKKFFQAIGLLVLICFSFFYTEKTVTVLKENDPLMDDIISNSDKYYYESIDAIIKDDEIITGISGRKVNINKTYDNMKKNGIFNDKLIIYDKIRPKISLKNNFNKYIVGSNNKSMEVALLFIIKDNKHINKLLQLLEKKNTKANFFIDIEYLNDELSTLYKISKNNEIYNYGNDGKYQKNILILGNNIIERNSNNKSNYCLALEKNNEIIDTCSKNNMHTILPISYYGNGIYNMIKSSINGGNIVLLELSSKTIDELSLIIDFINKKGLKIVKLSDLLSEQ